MVKALKKTTSPLEDMNMNINIYSYDNRKNVSNTIRQETVLMHKPPKNSLSELIVKNDLISLELRLKENIDPNTRDEIGDTFSWTPLYWGVKTRNIQAVKILLSYNADINIVVNDCDECCGTVLDLVTLRSDDELEGILREFAEKEDLSFSQSFKAIRTKLRGKSPAFNFRYYGKNNN